MKRIIVAGCGPAGMMAALAAAKEGASVTILEAMEKPGKKLLMTGNGRCNLTNMDPELPTRYFSAMEYEAQGTEERRETVSFAGRVFRRFSVENTLDFFHSIGLLTAEKNGCVYPYTNQASSVLELLLTELKRYKVKLKFSEKITRIERDLGGWKVGTTGWTYPCDHLILCCGSRAVPVTGSDGSGYRLAASVGHVSIPPLPALTGLICRGNFFQACSGVRCHAQVTLLVARTAHAGEEYGEASKVPSAKWLPVGSEIGELQWTENGISGIVVFQLSRFAALALNHREKVKAVLDFLPELSEQELYGYLQQITALHSQAMLGEALSGLLPKKLLEVLLGQLRIKPTSPAGDFGEVHCSNLVHAMKSFSLSVIGTRDFDQCQVCSGGIPLSQVDPATMISRQIPTFSFAGEILDMDGPCGGYNLQWAWSSGYVAGRAAAREQE